MRNSIDVMKELEFITDQESGNMGFRSILQGKKIVAIEFLYRWKSSDNRAEKKEREALADELVPNNPMLVLAREAYQIVMAYPSSSGLTDKHLLAIQSVDMGIISMPEDMPFDDDFKRKTSYVILNQ